MSDFSALNTFSKSTLLLLIVLYSARILGRIILILLILCLKVKQCVHESCIFSREKRLLSDFVVKSLCAVMLYQQFVGSVRERKFDIPHVHAFY